MSIAREAELLERDDFGGSKRVRTGGQFSRPEVGAHMEVTGPSSVRGQFMHHCLRSRVGQQLEVLQAGVVIVVPRVRHIEFLCRGIDMAVVMM